MTHRPPLDPRRKAFGDALGHLVAEVVWREVTGAEPRNETKGGDLAPRSDGARRLAGCDADAVEVDDDSISDTAA